MKPESRNVLILLIVALCLVTFGLVMQFDAAVNAVAVLQTEGMTCGSCAGKVEKVLLERGGVASVQVNVQQGIVIASYDARAVDPRFLAAAISRTGFPSRLREVMSMQEFRALVAGGAGCSSGGCGNCSKKP